MLRIIQSSHVAGAKSYYSTADYLSEGQELVGHYRGKGAALLGLAGEVDKASWDMLCDNRHPQTGETLTVRNKDNRTVGYDFNFHVPKSVSLLFGVTRDERILTAFTSAMQETMQDIESEAETRVRKRGANENRTTGNLVWGEFVHFTSRPVDGVPDPQLHGHCFVFNVTHDAVEDRWKAAQFRNLKRDAPYFQAVFHSRLARNLADAGLPTQRTAKGWEIAGLAPSTLAKFSRRTQQIEEAAARKGVTDPEEKAELGAKTREKKTKGLSAEELRREWLSRLDASERESVANAYARLGGRSVQGRQDAAREAVDYAVEHCFERSSVVAERRLVAEALNHGVGNVTPRDIRREIDRQGLITAMRGGQLMATSREVLAEEKAMLDFARHGRGSCKPLGRPGYAIKRDWLNKGQRAAVNHVLTSHDAVILIRGAAGVGKTSAMQETVEAIEENGKRVFAFAPSAGASRGVLREKGFPMADTLARLLVDERLQRQVAGQVLFVDEAGLIGTKTMARLFDLADRQGCRIILQGDTAQHGSVEHGAALRQLEDHAGLKPAAIKEIQRQCGDYKEAVRALSEGRVGEAFDRLDRLGWIKELPDDTRYKAMAADYVAAMDAGKSCLAVSPTHAERRCIEQEIRRLLMDKGKLGNKEREFTVLEDAHLTLAQRRDPANYSEGDVLVFHQNAKGGFARGQRVEVRAGQELPLDQAERFHLFRAGKKSFAEGDMIRITRNGKTADGRHDLHNGSLYLIREFNCNGDIVLANGWTVPAGYGHLASGYCITSMASQGRDVNTVLIGQSAASYPATNSQQFYVSVSRGQRNCQVYCESKRDLREAVARSDVRIAASDLLPPADLHIGVRQRQREQELEWRREQLNQRHLETASHER